MHVKLNQVSAVIILGLGLSPGAAAYAERADILSPDKRLKAHAINFSQLSGWRQDQHEKALVAFKRSCSAMNKASQTRKRPGFSGTYAQWRGVCIRANKISSSNRQAARRFFEHNFIPLRLIGAQNRSLFTGYFEPEMPASLKRSKAYDIPLYRRPKDLKRNDKAYFTRAEIEKGALKNRGLEFVYLKNSVDAFFLHVQGSGRLRFDNGKIMRVGFAGKNGRPYTAIGKVLIDLGEIAREKMSMQAIRNWLTRHKQKAAGIMRQNQSFIFFRPLENIDPNLGPPGAQGVSLTPGRSLAIDKTLHAYGVPLWLETGIPALNTGASKPFHRLMIAQDTGTAIRGIVRGDIFWGSGRKAGEIAGRMKQPGKLFLLLPKDLAAKYMR